jgi:hypothetical protein
MLRIGKVTGQRPEEVLEKAAAFFGPQGIGLDIMPRSPQALEFNGGGGFVIVKVAPKDEGTEIDVTTREWDYDVRRFLREM